MLLPLLQNNLLGYYENLTTFSDNVYPASGFFDTLMAEIHAENTQALALSLTASQMAADITVTAGHKHDAAGKASTWRQVFSCLFHNGAASSIGTAPDHESSCFSSTGTSNMPATCRARIDVEISDWTTTSTVGI